MTPDNPHEPERDDSRPDDTQPDVSQPDHSLPDHSLPDHSRLDGALPDSAGNDGPRGELDRPGGAWFSRVPAPRSPFPAEQPTGGVGADDPPTASASGDRRRPGAGPAPWGARRTSRADIDAIPPDVTLPQFFGFSPSDSLVVIGINGQPTSAVHQTLSDLDPDDTSGIDRMWARYLDMFGAGAAQVTLIGYLDPVTHPRTGRVLAAVVTRCPLPVRDAAVISADWWWLICCDPRTCGVSPACQPGGTAITRDAGPDPYSPHLLPLHPPPGTGPGRSGRDCQVGGCDALDDQIDYRIHSGHGRGRDVFADALRPGYTPARDAVAARLPCHGGSDPAIERLLHRNLLDLEYGEYQREPSPRPMNAAMTAALLQALADPLLLDSCLAWTDAPAWQLYLTLARNAPAGWAAPVWALIAAHAAIHGHRTLARVAVQRALADQPANPLAHVLRDLIIAGAGPRGIRWALATRLDHVPARLHPESTRSHRPLPGPDGHGPRRSPGTGRP